MEIFTQKDLKKRLERQVFDEIEKERAAARVTEKAKTVEPQRQIQTHAAISGQPATTVAANTAAAGSGGRTRRDAPVAKDHPLQSSRAARSGSDTYSPASRPT